MAAPTGTFFKTNERAIEEVLNRDVETFLPELDPFFEDTWLSNEASGNARDIGRDMKIIKNYHGSFTGVIDQAAGTANNVIFGDAATGGSGGDGLISPKIFKQNLVNTWPDAQQGPNARSYQLAVPMRGSLTNLMLTLGELQAEATPAVIRDVIGPKMEGFARNIAHHQCNYLYLSQNDSYRLAQVEAQGTNNSLVQTIASNDTYRFNPSNEATHRFAVGQRLWLWEVDESKFGSLDGTTTTGAGSRDFIVTRVDELNNEVDIMHSSGGSLSGTIEHYNTAGPVQFNASATDESEIGVDNGDNVTASGNIWVLPNSHDGTNFTGYAGLNSWLKTGSGGNDNTLLGAEADGTDSISVVSHPEFKSMGVDLGSQPLTEHLMRKILKRFHSAKMRYGQSIDTLLASDGVILAYERQLIGREMIDRTGRLSSTTNQGSSNGAVSDGKGFSFTMDGKTYNMYTSCYVESGTVYGVKMKGGNWKKYTPATYRGLRSGGPSFSPFHFIAGALTGGSSNQLAIFNSSGDHTLVTEGAQMPGIMRMQLVPDQPAGLKLTNVPEDRIYSDN